MNQREADVYYAWDQLIDAAIRERPDAIIHAGDLFDRQRPSNRAIDRALDGLHRLSEAGIQTVIIAGNHETPSMRQTGHVFRLLRRIPHIYPLYSGEPEQVTIGDLLITGIAHSSKLAERVAEACPDPNAKYNLLVTHGAVSGIKEFRNIEVNQETLPDSTLQKSWDYVALGHYHEFTDLGNNIWYCGSNERFSFSEEDQVKGYAIVKFPGPTVKHHEIKCRQFVTINYDCRDNSIQQTTLDSDKTLTERLISQLEAINLEGKVVRQCVHNVSREDWATVDRRALFKRANAIYYRLTPNFKDTVSVEQRAINLNPPQDEWKIFLGGQRLNRKGDREWLIKKGIELLRTDE